LAVKRSFSEDEEREEEEMQSPGKQLKSKPTGKDKLKQNLQTCDSSKDMAQAAEQLVEVERKLLHTKSVRRYHACFLLWYS
jgi:hypothetical protein